MEEKKKFEKPEMNVVQLKSAVVMSGSCTGDCGGDCGGNCGSDCGSDD